MMHLPPLDEDEDDSLQFLQQHTPSWNPLVNEMRALVDSIRKKEASLILVTRREK
ncbi:MAG TPA: hypothetical protein VMY59_10000 [Candidatus Thermoplasmatota archaeon]|nr:hypothetical protein [Candidatus Thermoplasmatota archaeon]